MGSMACRYCAMRWPPSSASRSNATASATTSFSMAPSGDTPIRKSRRWPFTPAATPPYSPCATEGRRSNQIKTKHPRRKDMLKSLGAAILGLALAQPMAQAQEIKVGFIASLSGSQATLGRDLLDGFQLGVESVGGKLGGLPTEVLVRDDQGKPDAGAQAAQKLVERDRVSIVTGINLSNVLLAAVPRVLDADGIYLSINAGPSELAGKGCNSHFFSVAHQNDTVPETMGIHLNDLGIKNLYVMAPNFAAGKDMIAGLKRTFKGNIVAEIYTQFGQLDYSAELAKLRSVETDALFVFYPGG